MLADTNALIEAVRTCCWNAITGHFSVETVRECEDEARRGRHSRPGYVPVTSAELARLHAVHEVTDVDRAALALAYPDSTVMDDGERDLFAHAFRRAQQGDQAWVICSPDKASIRAGVALRWEDRLQALASLARAAGARPTRPFAEHFEEPWLSSFRTTCLLDREAGRL